MTIKTYVLDTNILLDDPSAVASFDDNEVIIPLIVLEEIDRFKDKPGELGANAREFSRYLGKFIADESVDLRQGTSTPTGGFLKVVTMSDLKSYGADLSDLPELNDYHGGDNKILQVMLGLANKAKKESLPTPILVTRDLQLRVKCRVLGILSEDRKKSGLPSSVGKLYTGVRNLEVSWGVTQAINEDRETPISLSSLMEPGEYETLSPNEYITLKSPDGTPLQNIYRHVEGERFAKLTKTPNVYKLRPRNVEQKIALDMLMDPSIKLVSLIGKSGSGKTLAALAAGLEQVLGQKKYKSLVVCRPIEPVGRDVGYLPGLLSEKMDPWTAPIKDNLKYLLSSADNGDVYSKKNKMESEATLDQFIDRGIIEIQAITFIRGRSISNAYIILDEAQNTSAHELKTIITRVGEGTKIVLVGDVEQVDNIRVDSMSNGLTVAVEKFRDSDITSHISLLKGERSELASLAASIL